jgi:hypothetical protein
MATLPTGNELKRLSLRGLVAYTARCARRVLPFYRLPADAADAADAVVHLRAVELAVETAMRFANGDDPDPDEAARVEEAVIRAVMAVSGGESPDTLAALSSNAAYAAANAVTQALAVAATTGSKTAEAAKVIAAAVTAADAAVVIDPLVRHGAVRDYRSLVRLRLGGFPDHGQPIDAGDDGVLGPIPLTRRAREALEARQADLGERLHEAEPPAVAPVKASAAPVAVPAAIDPPAADSRDVEQFRGEEQTLQSLGGPAADAVDLEDVEPTDPVAEVVGMSREPAQDVRAVTGPPPADGGGLLQRELHKQRSVLGDERRRLHQERESLREERDRFEREREQEEAERFRILEDLDARERQLAQDRSRLDADRQQLAEERHSVREERQALESEREAIGGERDAVAAQREAVERERAALDEERRALAESRASAQHERRALAEDIAAQQDAARALDDRVSRYEEFFSQFERWRQRFDALGEPAEPLEVAEA